MCKENAKQCCISWLRIFRPQAASRFVELWRRAAAFPHPPSAERSPVQLALSHARQTRYGHLLLKRSSNDDGMLTLCTGLAGLYHRRCDCNNVAFIRAVFETKLNNVCGIEPHCTESGFGSRSFDLVPTRKIIET